MVVVPAPMSITAAPRSASSSASAESPATYELATIASTSRWQRSIASIRLRATDTSVVATCMSMPKRRPSMPRGSRMPFAFVEHVADRERMQHGAPGAHRMAAAGGQHAGDVALGDRARDLDRSGDQLARRPAGGDRDHHRMQLHLRRPLGDVDGLAHRRFGFGEIDHGAGLDAARQRMAEAEHLDRVAALRQHVLGLARLEAARSGTRSCWCRRRARRPARSACGDSGFIFGVRPS